MDKCLDIKGHCFNDPSDTHKLFKNWNFGCIQHIRLLSLTTENFHPHHRLNKQLGLLFFINRFSDFFIENLGTEGEIKIKIKYYSST